MYLISQSNVKRAKDAGVPSSVLSKLELSRVSGSEGGFREYLKNQLGPVQFDKYVTELLKAFSDPYSYRSFNTLSMGEAHMLDKEVRLRVRKVPGGFMYEYFDKEGTVNACALVPQL